MALRRRDSRPLYWQLADLLRSQIATGWYRPTESLPAEAALARTHAVSVTTVRRALAALRIEALIDTERGRCSVVRQPPPKRTVALGADDRAMIRIPTDPERRRRRLPCGVAVIEIHHSDGDIDVLPADEIILVGKST